LQYQFYGIEPWRFNYSWKIYDTNVQWQDRITFRVLNSTDQKSKVNFEIFMTLSDWNDSQATGKSAWQRKAIGLNTTIPFNKIFF
jgi:hypothetical protein